MGMLDDAREMVGRGLSAAHGAAAEAAVERQPFMRGFARLCADGWEQGWHEHNGGNVTYRLRPEEVDACRPFFSDAPGAWAPMGVRAERMGNAFFAATGAGRHLRNVSVDLARNAGIVELSAAGDAWRVVWGFAGGGRPTSELASHVLVHEVRAAAARGSCRVLYHAHPANVATLTAVMPLDARTITRALWKAMTECIMVFPRGVGVVEWMVPGSAALARATAELMRTYDAAIWALHGLFGAGSDFDDAFGLMHAIEKAAGIYVAARAANGGSSDFPNTIADDDLREIARELSLDVNEDFLD